MADHNNAHALVVLVLGEDASKHRLHTKHAPEGPTYLSRWNLLGFAVARQCRIARLASREVGEYGIETASLDPLRGCGIVLRQDVGLAHKVPDHDEPVCIGVRERADEHRITDAEYGGNAPDAEAKHRIAAAAN